MIGTHDIAAFRSAADDRTTTVRTITEVKVSESPSDARLLFFDVYGDGFLHNTVRIIVGTLVDVARGRLEPGAVGRAFASLDRQDLGQTAPAKGLCLERVTLDVDLDSAPMWPKAGEWTSEGAKRL